MNSGKEALSEEQRRTIQAQYTRIRALMEKTKIVVVLKPEEKGVYREELLGVLRSVEKKIGQLNEKKDNKKDNKKRQTSIEFYRFHQGKLSMLTEWLLSPSRQFSLESMGNLVKYLNDLHISHDDSVFQDQLKELYNKIVLFAEEPVEIPHELFLSSFAHRPCVNDYLLSKQTKENTYRNSICPNYRMIDLSVLPNISLQVLFFMFYMHKGETEQYLAAKELMRRSWRYYTKFQIWIKRCQLPNFDNSQEYETGNYYTMGTEMIVRERKNIKINHKHLINKLG